MSRFSLIEIEELYDERGSLSVFEKGKNLPFELKRTYCIFNVPSGVDRGFHAHKSLKQVMVCVRGSVVVYCDDGIVQDEILLDGSNKGLYLDSLVWREMRNFSDDAILLVFASEMYDERDYVRDKTEFVKRVEGNEN